MSAEGAIAWRSFIPPGVTAGVDVLRGVGEGLRRGVGEGVHVGSMTTRLVGVGGMGVGAAEVGVEVRVGEAQLASRKLKPINNNLIWFKQYLPFGYGLPPHSLLIHTGAGSVK